METKLLFDRKSHYLLCWKIKEFVKTGTHHRARRNFMTIKTLVSFFFQNLNHLITGNIKLTCVAIKKSTSPT
jgi:hypothetical protein